MKTDSELIAEIERLKQENLDNLRAFTKQVDASEDEVERLRKALGEAVDVFTKIADLVPLYERERRSLAREAISSIASLLEGK